MPNGAPAGRDLRRPPGLRRELAAVTQSDDVLRFVFDEVPVFKAPVTPVVFDEHLFQRLARAYDEHRTMYKPLTEFKVTQAQLDELAALVPPADAPPSPAAFLLGIPVRLVDAFEESTVYELWLRSFLKQMRESLSADGPLPPAPEPGWANRMGRP